MVPLSTPLPLRSPRWTQVSLQISFLLTLHNQVHYSKTTETDGFVYPEPTIWEKSYSYNYALALPAKQAGEQRELIQSQAIGPSAKEQEGTEDTGGDRSAASKRRLGLESTKIEANWP